LVGNPKWKKTFGKPKHRREFNIKICLKEMMCEVVDCGWLRTGVGGGLLLNINVAYMELL
jgi:hypothetical protein